MYGLTYGYRTSLSPLMVRHMEDKFNYIKRKKYLKNNSRLLDIGSNDGTYLKIISKKDMRKKNPKFLLVLIWSFRKEVIKQEINFLNRGGI